MKGQAISEYEEAAKSLCWFLNRSHGMMITFCVVDFAKDEFGNLFFTNMKRFRVEPSIVNRDPEKAIDMKERANISNNIVKCTLCRINF